MDLPVGDLVAISGSVFKYGHIQVLEAHLLRKKAQEGNHRLTPDDLLVPDDEMKTFGKLRNQRKQWTVALSS